MMNSEPGKTIRIIGLFILVVIWYYCNFQYGYGLKKSRDVQQESDHFILFLLFNFFLGWAIPLSSLFILFVFDGWPETHSGFLNLFRDEGGLYLLSSSTIMHLIGTVFTAMSFAISSLSSVQVVVYCQKGKDIN